MQKLVAKLAAMPFVRKALEENADLSAFKGQPSLEVVLGVSAILISYVICWPLIALLSAAAVYSTRRPRSLWWASHRPTSSPTWCSC